MAALPPLGAAAATKPVRWPCHVSITIDGSTPQDPSIVIEGWRYYQVPSPVVSQLMGILACALSAASRPSLVFDLSSTRSAHDFPAQDVTSLREMSSTETRTLAWLVCSGTRSPLDQSFELEGWMNAPALGQQGAISNAERSTSDELEDASRSAPAMLAHLFSATPPFSSLLPSSFSPHSIAETPCAFAYESSVLAQSLTSAPELSIGADVRHTGDTMAADHEGRTFGQRCAGIEKVGVTTCEMSQRGTAGDERTIHTCIKLEDPGVPDSACLSPVTLSFVSLSFPSSTSRSSAFDVEKRVPTFQGGKETSPAGQQYFRSSNEEPRTFCKLNDTSSHEPARPACFSLYASSVSYVLSPTLSVLPLVMAYQTLALASATVRTLWISYLEFAGVGHATPCLVWAREGIGTRVWN
ncbi:hypothetical protein K438DRAFT_1983367 [Mycena galopus ATCC 62051]|nr:hypothetical protein K438DRAFT_1983367 [Mycena galopus ATCC 62051]